MVLEMVKLLHSLQCGGWCKYWDLFWEILKKNCGISEIIPFNRVWFTGNGIIEVKFKVICELPGFYNGIRKQFLLLSYFQTWSLSPKLSHTYTLNQFSNQLTHTICFTRGGSERSFGRRPGGHLHPLHYLSFWLGNPHAQETLKVTRNTYGCFLLEKKISTAKVVPKSPCQAPQKSIDPTITTDKIYVTKHNLTNNHNNNTHIHCLSLRPG